jgi:hypothetical protein
MESGWGKSSVMECMTAMHKALAPIPTTKIKKGKERKLKHKSYVSGK